MTTLLTLHIITMIISLTATFVSAISTLFGIKVRRDIILSNYAVTTFGVASGILLLLQAPVGAKCATLLGYAIAFAAVHRLYIRKPQQRSTIT